MEALSTASSMARDPTSLLLAQRGLHAYLAFLERALQLLEHPGAAPQGGTPTWSSPERSGRADYADKRVRTGLSARELEIVRMLAEGHSVGHIARVLELSPHTVRNHLKTCYRKVGVHTQIELMNHAFAKGLVAQPVR